MCSLDDIETELSSSDDLRLTIIREIGGRFAVALFAKSGSGEASQLELGGSGTLVMAGESHYILTAAHVWEFLKKANQIGITITDNIDHAFFMDVRAIVPTVEVKATIWNEWGPDLIFLKIPAEYAGTIKAFKGFYSPAVDGESVDLPKEVIENRVLLGAPYELGTFTQSHADLRIDGCFTDPSVPPVSKGDYDFLDLVVATPSDTALKSYGGMSGGGVWRVLIYCSQVTNRIAWSQRLIGVAFYELANIDGCRIVRCHGPQSVGDKFPTD